MRTNIWLYVTLLAVLIAASKSKVIEKQKKVNWTGIEVKFNCFNSIMIGRKGTVFGTVKMKKAVTTSLTTEQPSL